jgi:hypothetical protein
VLYSSFFRCVPRVPIPQEDLRPNDPRILAVQREMRELHDFYLFYFIFAYSIAAIVVIAIVLGKWRIATVSLVICLLTPAIISLFQGNCDAPAQIYSNIFSISYTLRPVLLALLAGFVLRFCVTALKRRTRSAS